MADVARGQEVRRLREARHLTQEELAQETGVTTKTVRAWEKGGGIRWSNAKKLGEVLGRDPNTLVTREDDPDDPLPYVAEDAERLERIEHMVGLIATHLDITDDDEAKGEREALDDATNTSGDLAAGRGEDPERSDGEPEQPEAPNKEN